MAWKGRPLLWSRAEVVRSSGTPVRHAHRASHRVPATGGLHISIQCLMMARWRSARLFDPRRMRSYFASIGRDRAARPPDNTAAPRRTLLGDVPLRSRSPTRRRGVAKEAQLPTIGERDNSNAGDTPSASPERSSLREDGQTPARRTRRGRSQTARYSSTRPARRREGSPRRDLAEPRDAVDSPRKERRKAAATTRERRQPRRGAPSRTDDRHARERGPHRQRRRKTWRRGPGRRGAREAGGGRWAGSLAERRVIVAGKPWRWPVSEHDGGAVGRRNLTTRSSPTDDVATARAWDRPRPSTRRRVMQIAANHDNLHMASPR